jgi:hypothetical protein
LARLTETSAAAGNDFGLTNDLSLVTVAPIPRGEAVHLGSYYDHPDLPMMRASFDDGIADIGRRLIARFGGRLLERYIDVQPSRK